ncbi:division/cell wall cluster transcriptional repressor MraZ [Desulfurella sp.]|uniref:division/cell wall cluster transcriptional repressor MraZ n=1 Tax=Desulfurella sp. TaxID=1962857 RepID=UPI0025BB1844|nr:division/cell wall cluster transcriptional repressor MraZ [Desulfurella sp.]
MLRGRFECILDDKGRIKIPSKFLETLKGSGVNVLVMTFFDQSIYAYPKNIWEELESKALNLPLTNKSARRFKRMFFSSAIDVNLDSQGRIIIPQTLRQLANIEKNIVVLGNLDHIELWSAQNWQQEMDLLMQDEEKLAQEIESLGIKL